MSNLQWGVKVHSKQFAARLTPEECTEKIKSAQTFSSLEEVSKRPTSSLCLCECALVSE